METTIFTDPAVAGLLTEHFVEVRVHQERVGEDEYAYERSIRDDVLRSRAAPIYMVMRPDDEFAESPLGVHKLSATVDWKEGILAFLEDTLKKAGRFQGQ